MKQLLCLIVCLLTLALALPAAAEEPGHLPERGVILPMTLEDENAGLYASAVMGGTAEVPELPLIQMIYTDAEGIEAVISAYSDKNLEDETVAMQFMQDLSANAFPLYIVALFEESYHDALQDDEAAYAQKIGENTFIVGRNDGHVYVGMEVYSSLDYTSPELAERTAAAGARAKELLDAAQFMPIAEPASALAGAFPAFSAQDLHGNTVTNEIFAGKDLTVVNIWGTFCGPCINEMPELAAWSAEMPENVQIIGLVSDLYSADDADTLDTALQICEATGVTFTNIVAEDEFYALLSEVVGVPTTLFVDGSGMIVGDPVVGANVPAYKSFVEAYVNAL